MTSEKELKEAARAIDDARRYAAAATTREDIVGVEESYWIAFNLLKDSPREEHRNICAECLEAVARILDSEGRPAAADDLRKRAEVYRKPREE